MSITNSLYIGVSGLQANGEAISIVGDNISNASTVGYKRDRASFSDVLGGELDGSRMGGGVTLGASQTMFDEGTITQTGNPLDLAISGGGMFVVKGNEAGQNGQFYTRDGRFQLDNTGTLTNQSGMDVQGYLISPTGQRALAPTNLVLGAAESPPVATTSSAMKLNLDANAAVLPAFDPTNPSATSNYATSETVYDSLGNSHNVQVFFHNNGNGNWDYHAMVDGGDLTGGTPGQLTEIANGQMSFNTAGALQSQTPGASSANFVNAAPGQAIAFNFGDDIASGGTGMAGTTQFAGASSVNGLDVDGRAAGKLTSLSVGTDGTISGTFDNGDTIKLAQVALANFTDQNGLTRMGDGLMAETAASGKPLIDVPGTGARGSITSGALESSNVDLSNELVTLIAYQRAFEANAKTVTTADQMMTDVNNLKQ